MTKTIKVFDLEKPISVEKFLYNEAETFNLKKECFKKQLSLDDVRRIALWKYDRVIQISEEVFAQLASLATQENLQIDSSEAVKVLHALTKCKGVGFPLASAILKFIRPDVFPIVDVRAYRALYGKKIYKYTLEKYVEYSSKVQSIAKKNAIPLCVVDEQLYLFDKNYNGTI